MKHFTLLILFSLIYLSGNTQNSTLVNAYYTRAQQEYTQENYGQAISFLEKANEYLGATTNPEITYLLAKSHYRYDVNVLKAKQLFLKFRYEAKAGNHKTEEVSEIINDIENSDAIDDSGYFKDLSGRSGTKKTFFRDGTLQKSENFENGLLNGDYQENFENGILYKEGSYENGFLNGILKTYHNNGNIKLITHYSDSEKHGTEEVYNIHGILTETLSYALNKKNGSFKTFYEDGKKIKAEGSYKDNTFAGVYKKYYENGQLALSCIYGDEGIKDGPEIKYYKNGNQQWIKNYQKGKLVGIQKHFYDNKQLSKWEVYNEEGKQHGENIEYYKNGVLAINIRYENGHVIDVINQQNAKGRSVSKSKLKQNPYGTGQITKLHDNNKISYHAIYTDGVLDGEIKTYYENGQLKCEGFYNYGSRDGEFKHYYSTGTLKSEGHYKSNNELGFKDGLHTEYYETGELKSKTVYQYNKEIEKTTYYKNGNKSAAYNYVIDDWEYFAEAE
tara:strand:- start:18461 stop:19966 length:1506 start_codon:yes stop_codon:yes gene_type:complete